MYEEYGINEKIGRTRNILAKDNDYALCILLSQFKFRLVLLKKQRKILYKIAKTFTKIVKLNKDFLNNWFCPVFSP